MSDAPALRRGVEILQLVVDRGRPVPFGDLAQTLEIPTASAARFLNVLCDELMLVKTPAGYELGERVGELANAGTLGERLRTRGAPVIAELSAETENTTLLLAWENRVFQCVAKTLHPTSLGMQSIGNVSCDVSNTPWGWIACGQAEDADLPLLRHPMTKRDTLRDRLPFAMDQLQRLGVVADNESVKTIRLAAPVYDGDGMLVAVMVVGGNSLTIPLENEDQIGSQLAARAHALSTQLGCANPASHPIKRKQFK